VHEIATLTEASLSATRSRIFYAQRELREMAERDPTLREALEGGKR
jgi:DNA-directed RNA polymerase specialized sigma24 family protein